MLYVEVVCVAGPKAGQRLVLVDNMSKYANNKELLNMYTSEGDEGH